MKKTMKKQDFINAWNDTRNIRNEYKNLTNEQIKLKLRQNSLPFAVCMQHIVGDFNFGTVVRSSNAFGAREVFYLGGTKKWDRRSAVGSHNYIDVSYLSNFEDLERLKATYYFVGVDNIEGSVPLEKFTWESQLPPLMIFGEETNGLVPEVIEMCDVIVSITQRGSVPSMNVGAAASITMYDFCAKYKK